MNYHDPAGHVLRLQVSSPISISGFSHPSMGNEHGEKKTQLQPVPISGLLTWDDICGFLGVNPNIVR